MLIKTDLICDIGCVRLNNEDMILLDGELYRDTSTENNYELTDNVRFMAVVADGMGGHNGGEVASEAVLKSFNDFLYNLPSSLSEIELVSQIKHWAQTANDQVVGIAEENQNLQGMGSTFCGIMFYEKHIFSLNIGDSRLYRFRDGVLKQLSTDHSMRKLIGDNAVPNNVIYNSFGTIEDIFIDVNNISEQVFDNDIFLICSDGLTDMLSDEDIENMLSQNASCIMLTDKAKDAGGKDNISIIFLKIKDLRNKNE